MSAGIHLFVPGRLDQRTGGYIYDRRVVDGLRSSGRTVRVHELDGRFPDADERALKSLATAAAHCAATDLVLFDSLCLGAARHVVARLASDGCACVPLVHHPASLEDGVQGGLDTSLFREEKAALNHARRCIVTSRATGKLLHTLFGVGWKRIGVVSPGVDRCALAHGSNDGRPMRLLSVGTVSHRKDYITLVRALSQLADFRWSLDCYGSLDREPEAADAVWREVQLHDLSQRVRFHGEVGESRIRTAYADAHLFVMSSRFEGYGMVLSEALAHGLPIVATDAGPTTDILPGEGAIIVPAGEPDRLAGALRRVLTDPARYRALHEAARRAAATLDGWDVTVARFITQLDLAAA